jgi:hypothetical protein
MEWIDELAGAMGAEPLSPTEVESLLQVARDIAHGVERKVTPLATFLLGMDVQHRLQGGLTRAAVVDSAIDDLRSTLPPAAT